MSISSDLLGSSSKGGKTNLAADITRNGSKQTYYTLRFLADGDRLQDALRAYAYFRWVDDQLDADVGVREEKLAFISRQCALLDACYRNEPQPTVTPEERMLVELVRNNPDKESGLCIYLYNMMNVMSFDVERRGRRVSEAELTQYSLMLSKAVTEYMFYFIGHDDPPPQHPARYQAVIGAHVVHMLRDLLCDIDLGYYNFPADVLASDHVSLENIHSQAFRKWVFERIQVAHQCFIAGREYIARVKNLRCRLAGFTYLARFEWMLRAIEKDHYCLRPAYPERKKLPVVLWMAGNVLASLLNFPRKRLSPVELDIFTEQCEGQ
jgi:phytoene/squalene synthetase